MTLPTLPPLPGPAARTAAPTLVAVAHGSRDPEVPGTVTALLDRVRALRPGLRVELGHIELNEPLLSDTLAGQPYAGRAVLVPLLFGRGYHVKHDLPGAASAAGHLEVAVAAPLGPHPLLADALADRLREAGWPGGRDQAVRRPPGPATVSGARPWSARRGALVLAAAGSRDPDSARDTDRMAYLLSRRLGGTPVVPAYASATAPTVADAVAGLRERGYRRIGMASYFTAPGLFAARCARAAPGVAAAPLGAHPALARLVLRRYDQAVCAAARKPAAV